MKNLKNIALVALLAGTSLAAVAPAHATILLPGCDKSGGTPKKCDDNTGPQGPAGPAGPQGPQGEQGPVGPQGPQGEQGPVGPMGPQGPAGADGKDGINGTNGIDGKDGRDGVDGLNGKDGKDGRDGIDGKDGLNGRDGVDGKDGTNGLDGKDGRDGVDGVNGKDGLNGKDGIDGVDGKDGRDGTDGKDGATGATGAKGDKGDTGATGATGAQGTKGDKGDTGAAGRDGTNGVDGKDGKDVDPAVVDNLTTSIADAVKQANAANNTATTALDVANEAQAQTQAIARDMVTQSQFETGLASTLEEAKNYTDQQIRSVRFDLNKVRKDANAAVAGAMAVAGIPQVMEPGKGMFGGAVGHWDGQTAFALGASVAGERVVVKAAASINTRGKAGGTIGAGFQF